MESIDLHSIFYDNLVFQITLMILKLPSFVINITNRLGLIYFTLIKL